MAANLATVLARPPRPLRPRLATVKSPPRETAVAKAERLAWVALSVTAVRSQFLRLIQIIHVLTCLIRYGYCGKSSAYCGVGCNAAHGTCSGSVSSPVNVPTTLATVTRSSDSAPSSAVKVSPNARCGWSKGAIGGFSCIGSQWGDCCSKSVDTFDVLYTS